MEGLERGQASLRTIAVLVLCALYFIMSIGLTLLSSGIYRDAVASSDESYARRTALSYIVNQIRQTDAPGGISLTAFGDGDALALGSGEYVTLLYCHGGQLMELFAEVNSGLGPADGTVILPLDSLSITAEEGLITITADGVSTAVAPRAGMSGEVAS